MNNLRIFLYKLLHKNTITINGRLTDYELSFMIRNFIKNNKGYLLAYNINHIMNIIINYPLSCIIILNFYRLTVNRNEILEKINEWHTHYKNDLFWKLLSYEQYYYLLQLLHFVKYLNNMNHQISTNFVCLVFCSMMCL